eukprot:1255244-Ditylum_brightwellii.AAC.1
MYNMKQRINHSVTANCPAIVYLDNWKRMVPLIDVTCPMDVNMVTAAATKHKKYRNLEIAMTNQYKLCKI